MTKQSYSQDTSRRYKCEDCGKSVPFYNLRRCSNCGTESFYCFKICIEEACTTRNCGLHATCWDEHLPRSANARSRHQPINPLADLFVELVTHSESNEQRHRELHQQDLAASWFNVAYPEIEPDLKPAQPVLQITDRFRQLCNPGMLNNDYVSSQYPGFVSFIGDTSAGKSTLVKAMLLMAHLDFTGDDFDQTMIQEQEEISRIQRLERAASASGYYPVTRSSNIERLVDPTSLGVSLYKDIPPPHDLKSKSNRLTPILFADCEGFRAGTAPTSAERSRHAEQRFTSSTRDVSVNRSCSPAEGRRMKSSPAQSRRNPNVIHERLIEADSFHGKGKDGAELFYARFLYTVSDVIVFVTRQDQSLFHEMQKLLEWAKEAVHHAVGSVPQKTLIIVRHAASLHSHELYNPDQLRRSLLDRLSPLWDRSPKLQEFRDQHNKKQERTDTRIEDNDALFGMFFQKVRVSYVPDHNRVPASELFRQYRSLRGQIFESFTQGQTRRANAWMQYNVTTLSHVLDRAFEHFRTLSTPFNFYEAARNDNPDPATMSGHIANFLRLVHDLRDPAVEMAKDVVAAACLSWALREFDHVQEPDEIFKKDLRIDLAKGIEEYSQRFQRCSFTFPSRGACVLHRAQHETNHADQEGNRLPGSFGDSGSKLQLIAKSVNAKFRELFTEACPDKERLPTPEKWRELRRKVFHQHKSWLKGLYSNKTCLSCMQAVPDYVLGCGHAFCDRCVRELGNVAATFESAWKIDVCLLCGQEWRTTQQLVRFKPPCAGVRILTLDGGGIRGIMELVLLELVQKRMGIPSLLIKDCFDLIMGTSTGGLIALGLGISSSDRDLTIFEMKKEFMELAQEAFRKPREGSLVASLDPAAMISKFGAVFGLFKSVYPTKALRQCLQRLFGPDLTLFGPSSLTRHRSVHVAVTSARASSRTLCLITNYNRHVIGRKPHEILRAGRTDEYGAEENDDTKLEGIQRDDLRSSTFRSDDLGGDEKEEQQWEGIEREDQLAKELKVWEAGLATAAAPFYFKPFYKPETKKQYLDGGLCANFPGEQALHEMTKIWATSEPKGPHLDIMVSAGTGIQQKEVGFPLAVGGLDTMFKVYIDNLDSGRAWEEFKKKPDYQKHSDRIFRLNSSLPAGGNIPLNDYRKMEAISTHVEAQGQENPILVNMVESVAGRLLASLFFFEPANFKSPISSVHHGTVVQAACSGSIRCRLAHRSPEMLALVRKVKCFWLGTFMTGKKANSYLKEVEAYDIEGEQTKWTAVKSTDDGKLRFLDQGRDDPFRVWMNITAEERSRKHLVAVTFEGFERCGLIPISGFPVTLHEIDQRCRVSRRS